MSQEEETEPEPEEEGEEQEKDVVDVEMLELEIPVSSHHKEIYDVLDDNGAPMKRELAKRLQPNAENAIHDVYQQSRYQQ